MTSNPITETSREGLGFCDSDRASPDEIALLCRQLVEQKLTVTSPVISEITSHLALSAGKGIRTVLLANCAAGPDGLAPCSAVKAAAAIEILHMATLVHDDIIDDATTRRGVESVQSKFGKKQAVICGDYLLCIAADLASSIEEKKDTDLAIARHYLKAVKRICLGELEQNIHSGDINLSALGYIKIIAKKTAALFYLAAFCGANIGECSKLEAKYLGRFSLYLGLIFQIVDDIKDYAISEKAALKPVKNDIMTGVVTLPLIFGMFRDEKLKSVACEVIFSGREVDSFVKNVCASGGLEDSVDLARKYAKKAKKALDKVDNPQKVEKLSQLLDWALAPAKHF